MLLVDPVPTNTTWPAVGLYDAADSWILSVRSNFLLLSRLTLFELSGSSSSRRFPDEKLPTVQVPGVSQTLRDFSNMLIYQHHVSGWKKQRKNTKQRAELRLQRGGVGTHGWREEEEKKCPELGMRLTVPAIP